MAAVADEYEEDYDEYYDDDEDGVSGFVVLVVGLVVMVVFCAVVWFAYQHGIQKGEMRTPRVTAEAAPVKMERPLELTSNAPREEVTEALEGNAPTQLIVDASAGRDPLEGFGETTSAAAEASREAIDTTRTEAVAKVEADDRSTGGVDIGQIAEAATLSVNKVTPVRQDPSASTSQPTAGNATSGTHVVQVGAFRSQLEAIGFFDSMKGKYGDFVASKQPDIQRADLGERGIFFRLRIGPFVSKSQAQTYCADLKTRGQDCLTKAL